MMSHALECFDGSRTLSTLFDTKKLPAAASLWVMELQFSAF